MAPPRKDWFCAYCGKSYYRAARRYCSPECGKAASAAKLSARLKGKPGLKPRNGADHSCRQCGKVFYAPASSRNTHFCSHACYIEHRWGNHDASPQPIVCAGCGTTFEAKLSANRSYCSPSCRLRKMWSKPANKAKIKAALSISPKVLARRMRQHFPAKMTGIERALHDEFKRRRLRFEMHRTMFERYQPDFVFESARLIVQADGAYWHSRPEVVARDERFNKLAEDAGWMVMRFLEGSINADAAACARAVARYVRTHPAASTSNIVV